ncbi:MAG TPA: sigma-70 family RNA polymerase sigma factor [Actinomycetota bacterium]|nr:sigma-70 family RNA polymerase sigma factor [Actinomycetota bacterium]
MEASATATESRSAEAPLEFEVFFLEHHEPLFRALWLVTRNRHEAEEVMQDAFLRLLERWPEIQAAENLDGYLYRTAMNVFRSRLRRASVALRKAIRQLPSDDQLSEIEDRDAVIRALAPLPARQRAAVVLMDVLGLSSAQAGEALGISAVTVRVLAARGRARLREVLDEDG